MADSRNVTIKRIGPSASPAMSASSAAPAPSALTLGAGASVKASKRAHGSKKQNMFADAMLSPDASSDASPGFGLDSKRTVRKKVVLGMPPLSAVSPSGDAAVAAIPSPGTKLAVPGAASLRAAGTQSARHRPSVTAAGLSSERHRSRGASAALSPSSGAGLSSTRSPNKVGDLGGDSPAAFQLRAPDEGSSSDDEDHSSKKRHHSSARRPSHSHANGSGGSGSSAGGGALRGARMDDGSGLDPAYQDIVRKNPLMWVDPSFAAKHSDTLFAHMTFHQRSAFVNKEPRAQHMDSQALHLLAEATVERFLERHREFIAKTNPKFTAAQVEAALMKELPHTRMGAGVPPRPTAAPAISGIAHVLSGSAPTIEIPDLKAHVFSLLRRELDKDKDGKISRTDFIMQWKPVVTKLMTVEKESKDICVIL